LFDKEDLTQEQQEVRDLLLQGNTSSEVSKIIWDRKSKESTIRGWVKKGLLGEQEDTSSVDELTPEVLDVLCDSPDWNVANLAKRLRSAQRSNNQLRKVQRELFDGSEGESAPSIESIVAKAVQSLSVAVPVLYNYIPTTEATPATLEVLLSDWQVAKLSRYYNSDIAKQAMKLYGEGILQAIEERKNKFKVERIVFAMLGDLCEDNEKHGIQSAISTDSGLAEQVHDSIEHIWKSVLSPLAELKIPMDVICVVGNHGSSTRKGMGTYKEGRYSFDFIVHKTLESFCRISGYDHITFDIPEGIFGHLEIYGKLVIYEHGYNNPLTEKGMVDQMRKRGAQLQIHPTYWRQADKHHHICYGQGEQVCNSAFFGVDQEGLEYSAILGFNSIPSQTIMFHTNDNTLGRSNIKDIINIQVAITDQPTR